MRQDRPPDSREVLERAARDTQSIGGSPMARLGRHLSGADAVGEAEGGSTDPIELWGRRIGRALSVVLAFVLTWWLGAQLGWW